MRSACPKLGRSIAIVYPRMVFPLDHKVHPYAFIQHRLCPICVSYSR